MNPLWTQEEDQILDNAVAIFETKEQAFEEAAKELGKSKSACSQRYYYKHRSKAAKPPKLPKTSINQMVKDLTLFQADYERLRSENKKQAEELKALRKQVEVFQQMEKDYKEVLQIMDRARKLTFLPSDTDAQPSFKMDKNGNLERVN